MPLSPDDVVEKRFNPTRVREGYAQDEVDDFLDEVVTELRRLHSENDDLRSQLERCRARVADLTAAAAARESEWAEAAQTFDAAAETMPWTAAAPVAEAPSVPAQPPAPVPMSVALGGTEDPAAQAAGVIALAQRLHDEYVREGERQRDELLADARERAQRTITEAETQRDRALGDLQTRRQELEEAIAQLQGRESTYREQLESFLVDQLEDLRHQPQILPDGVAAR